MVYEKINKLCKINKINKNCIRNMLSIEGLCNEYLTIIKDKKAGLFNILSNNDINLEQLTSILYKSNIPDYFEILDGELNVPNMENKNIMGENIVHYENINEKIKKLEVDMRIYLNLKDNIEIKKLTTLSQPRGDMVEITDLTSKRLYKITLTKNSVRGNHFHFKQIEDFYINKGSVIFLLCHKDNLDVIYCFKAFKNDLIRIKPNIIHTLANDYYDNVPEIIISSTQEFIPNRIPDTEYINIV